MEFLGPKVVFTEIDQSGTVPNVPTAVGALVGRFQRGPLEPVFVTSKSRFKNLYTPKGKLNQSIIEEYAACSYLEQDGAALWALRVVGSDCLYGGVEIVSSTASENDNSAWSAGSATPSGYTFATNSGTGDPEGLVIFYGANPGAWNNQLSITISDVDTTNHTFVVSVDETIDGEVFRRESYTVSCDPTKTDGYGRSMYVEQVFTKSDYVRAYVNSANTDIDPKETSSAITFAGGDDGTAPGISEVTSGWQVFRNKNAYSIGLLIQGGFGDQTLQTELVNIAHTRQDCVAYLDIPFDTTEVSAVLSYVKATLAVDDSYARIFAPWIRVYDYDNDDPNMYIPPSGVVAGLRAKTDYYYYPWRECAGIPEGVIDCLGLSAYYDQADRDQLSPVGVNVFIKEPGRYVLWDNRTLQKQESAFSFEGPRRLLIVMRETFIDYAKGFMFKPLTEATRKRFVAGLDDRLRRYKAQEGVYEYRIICDPLGNENGNNPPGNVDQGILTADIFIKPVRAIRFIQLRVTVTRNSVDFSVREELIANNG